MKVFISWSGTRSRAIGDVLRRWLPSVLQAVRPYFSPDDVAKGARWSSEIAKELDASRIGLLIITPENQEAPWLLFEAGALAKNLDRSKVCPLLFGKMEPTDVKGPLVQFQAAQFSKEEMIRVLKMINIELADNALSSDVLESVFEMWWPKLNEQVETALEVEGEIEGEERRSERDMIEEVLALTRRSASERERRPDFDHPVWDDLFRRIVEIAHVVQSRSPGDEAMTALQSLVRPLEYMSKRSIRPRYARQAVEELRSIIDSYGGKISPSEPSLTDSGS